MICSVYWLLINQAAATEGQETSVVTDYILKATLPTNSLLIE